MLISILRVIKCKNDRTGSRPGMKFHHFTTKKGIAINPTRGCNSTTPQWRNDLHYGGEINNTKGTSKNNKIEEKRTNFSVQVPP